MSFPGLGRAGRTDGLRAEGAGERTEPLGSHRAPARHRTRARGALPSTAQALRGVDCHRLRKGRTSPRCLSTAMQVMVRTSVTTAADCTKGTILQTKAPARGDRRVTHRGAGAPPAPPRGRGWYPSLRLGVLRLWRRCGRRTIEKRGTGCFPERHLPARTGQRRCPRPARSPRVPRAQGALFNPAGSLSNRNKEIILTDWKREMVPRGIT